MFCPTCGGLMRMTLGMVKFSRGPFPVQDHFLTCSVCPAVTQVASGTGFLIDYPGWELADLAHSPLWEQTYMTEPMTTRLLGRRDS